MDSKRGLRAGLSFLIFVLFQNVASAAVTCLDAREIINMALRQHLVHKSLTTELVERTIERFKFLAGQYNVWLSKQELAAIDQKTKSADVRRVGIAMATANCEFFEEETEILKKAYQRLRATFTNPEDLAREILQHKPSGIKIGHDYTAPDLETLRVVILDRAVKAVEAWKAEAPAELSALYAARTFFKALEQYHESLRGFAAETMLKSFMLALDPHSSYLSPRESAIFEDQMAPGFDGIGVINMSGPFGVKITALVPQGPAEKSSKLAVGDVITAIDGKAIPMDMDQLEIDKRIRGKSGTEVELTVGNIRNRQLVDVRTVKITRGQVPHSLLGIHSTLDEVKGKLILTIHLSIFYDGSGDDLEAEIVKKQREAEALFNRPVDAMVLDLRGNSGGSVPDAVQISGGFVNATAVVGIAAGEEGKLLSAGPNSMFFERPLVIAIDPGSASASELVSGTLKDLDRALIVGGPKSFGKGTVQQIMRVPQVSGVDRGEMKITIGQFYTASGKSTQNDGISPHVAIPGPKIENPKNERAERNLPYALPSAQTERIGEPEGKNPSARANELAPRLQAASNARLEGRSGLTFDEQTTEIKNVAADYCEALLIGKNT